MVVIRRATSPAEVMAAAHLFDGPVRPEWAQRFLNEPTHHLLLADREGVPVGMVTGMELTHPDKGTEMFLYELAVDPAHRRRGVGRELVEALGRLARERGCHGMWVAVDPDNLPARAAYAAAGVVEEGPATMMARDLRGPDDRGAEGEPGRGIADAHGEHPEAGAEPDRRPTG
ncbi:GNAT family N-acetyltransferase [Streptomyces calidiresistens]|uniref:GNAT family N-acetyltransferase n=1 Tax=Streptomyces calidiresistens TaxID=1485586 RepID=A0A7W3T8X5_9ACTN|nr:GNAT family N-acetyltransferase [Streptomyces calidiresistens]MBB0232963.1 GNAT family N-acetyltransferase [Streptomyces calidiresistens]